MAASRPRPAEGRKRGEIETLPSGSLRVKVYAGIDPLTGKRNYLTEVIPDSPAALKDAKAARTRLINQVDEQRNPRTKANVNQLMDRYLELLDVDVTTRKGYEGYIRNHVRPLLGELSVAKLDGEVLDSFYSILRRCRTHCDGRAFMEHSSSDDDHECDDQCRWHTCKPLKASSIRQVHFCLSGALTRAVRWRWITVNPLDQAEPPKAVKSDPDPPTPEQAASIVNEAFKDPAWGVFVWLTMTTGARRGEMCALRLDRLDLNTATLSIKTSIAQDGAKTWEKPTKTHQQRRIALDKVTVSLLTAYRASRESDARELGITIPKDGRLFSPSPDHLDWLKPSTVTQRFHRMCARLGWDMHIHQLRHYSATELIAAGVDVRTVAGRLGHGGGGSTTLRVYTAWVSEADQRAAGNIDGRMPTLPIDLDLLAGPSAAKPTPEPDEQGAPYQRIASDLRGAINSGILKSGDYLPTIKDIRERYRVSVGTAHRALGLLTAAGLATAGRGRRATVSRPEL
ncbi:tyrosine-type recombinase/integrase [Pseudonocardia spinosispora]|uniref:tyrosine-type recombinase/integrase n=1 Tax=Pseudonocardia spinosispora TaxID=103441 RepID=UPI000490C5F6|nr:tyrosine-type recombinase/integrase [Pseudonocardia spinosispora]